MTLEEIEQLKSETLAWVDKRIQEIEQQPKLERWKPEDNGYGFYCTTAWGGVKHNTNPFEIYTHYNSFNCFQTEQEAQQEALRTRARRKLEWYARELNAKSPAHLEKAWIIKDSLVKAIDRAFLGLGSIAFNIPDYAEYALSQMTSEELEALR